MGVPRPINETIIARPKDIVPSSDDIGVVGVCNPGGTVFTEVGKEKIYLLLRVIEKTKSRFSGHIAFPKAIPSKNGDYKVRWEWERIDKDVISENPSSLTTIELEQKVRPTYISHFRLAESEDGINFRISEKPTFFPQMGYEEFGIEDARITKFNEGINIHGEFYKHMLRVQKNMMYARRLLLQMTLKIS